MTDAGKPITHVRKVLPWVLVIDTLSIGLAALVWLITGNVPAAVVLFAIGTGAVAALLIRARQMDKQGAAPTRTGSIVE